MGEDGPHVGVANAADAAQLVADDGRLGPQLGVVAHVLEGAVATDAEVAAARRDAVGRRLDDGQQFGAGGAVAGAGQPDAHRLARDGKGHEDSPPALVAAEGQPAVGHVGQGQSQFSHGSSAD